MGVTLHFMTSKYQPVINLNSSSKHTHASSTVSMHRLKVGNSVYVAVASAPVSNFIVVYLLFEWVATTLLVAGLTLIFLGRLCLHAPACTQALFKGSM